MLPKTIPIETFSTRQLQIMTWWVHPKTKDMDGIIADGAIRSGKTLPMSLSFVLWSMSTFNGQQFSMSGKTIETFRRNVLRTLKSILQARGYKVEERRTENAVTISKGGVENTYYIFGGKDERSQDTVQGATLAGAYFDEVALMPQSFVLQMTARCSVEGAKLWFNCNPEYPSHWFYKDWIQKANEQRLIYLHFTMDDNPSLSDQKKETYKRRYTGVFYKRFILGLWTTATGIIYQQLAENAERYIIDEPPPVMYAQIGVDFGGTKSAHAFVCTGFTQGYNDVVILDEYYHDNRANGRLSPTKLTEDFVAFVKRCKAKYKVFAVYCDSAEQTLIEGFQVAVIREGINVEVRNALKGAINERIALYNTLIAQDRLKIVRGCQAVTEAFKQAVYADALKDTRLDDGTTNIDSLDATEYSTESVADILLERY